MKKIIATICAFVMLLSFATTAFASDWDVLDNRYTSYDATVEFSLALNKPLEFLSVLNETAGLDVKYLVEELTKAKFTAKIQAEVSEDARKAKMAMAINSNVPLNLSEDLKFGADVTLHVWVDFDFTNFEETGRFKYDIIIKNPLDGSYIYIDYFKLFDDSIESVTDPESLEAMAELFSKIEFEAGVQELVALTKAVYEKNATLTKVGNEYTITFTNNGLVDMGFELMAGYFDTEYAKSLGVDASMLELEEADINAAQDMVKGLGIFGENDAFVMKIKTNAAGQMIEAEESVHFDFNICEVAAALEVNEADMYPLTKENSDIDITLKTKTVYEKINEKNVVQMPALTAENSINLMDMLTLSIAPEPGLGNDYYYDEDFYFEYQSEAFWDYARGAMDRGGMYVDIEQFLDSAQWDDDNLTGMAMLGEDGTVAMTLTSDNFGTVTVTGNINSDEYMLNSTKLWARKPFKIVDEYDWDTYTGNKKLYVNMDVLNYILAAKVQSITTYITDDYGVELTNPEYYFDIVRPNPAYVGE